MVVFVGVYSFNNPQALEESLREILNISQTQFQYLYSLYALPNIFTLIAVGYVVDLIGTRKSIIGLSVGIAITQLIVAIAVQAKDYNMLLVGRLLFGIAAEGIFIPAANIISFWFQGK